MASKKSAGDDLDLSLTGSQISARSSSNRRGSLGQIKRPNSLVDVRHSKLDRNDSSDVHERLNGVVSSHKVNSSASQQTSTPALPSHRTKQLSLSSVGDGGDFLALFESAQTRMKRPASAAKSDVSKGKRPAANAVKVLWKDGPLKVSAPGIVTSSHKKGAALSSDRSEGPHNIFRPDSVISQSDEDLEEIEESLSQSINKLQSLQSQLSGINKNHPNGTIPATLSAAAVDPINSQRSANSVTPRFLSAVHTPRSVSSSSSPRDSSAKHPALKSSSSGLGGDLQTISLANNMTSQGQRQKMKASLSSIENSYHNIKHKMPVNQVGRVEASARASSASTKQKSASLNPIEESLLTLNAAATKIQHWFKRHHNRCQAEKAAVRRLMSQKREEILQQSVAFQEKEHQRLEERRQLKEDREHQARLDAIKELNKKREEKRNQVKQKAEDEMKYLQASGKVTKTPSNTNLGGARKKILSSKTGMSASAQDLKGNRGVTSGEDNQGTSSKSVAGANPSHNDFFQGDEQETEEKLASEVAAETATQAGTRTTLTDLYETLRKLEEEERLPATSRTDRRIAWLDDLEKDQEGKDGSNLTAENLEKLNASKDGLAKSGTLTQDKLKSIMSFLDEVQVSDRLSEIDSEINRMNEELAKPALQVSSGEEIAQLEKASVLASEVTNTVLSQRLELDEKARTVSILQRALNQQRELTLRHAKEADKELKKHLAVQKDEYEQTIGRHLSFIDQLIEDKKALTEKCEKLVTKLKTVDGEYQNKIKALEEEHTVKVTKVKEIQAAAEKLRREKWIEEQTKKLKDMTIKGLEPDIQRLINKHKAEIKRLKEAHEAEMLNTDGKAAQRYMQMMEELRVQLEHDKEAAVARERELAKERYEKQLQQEEEAYQQQRRRLFSEIQNERDILSANASRQKQELDAVRRQIEDSHRVELTAIRDRLEREKEEQDRRHNTELRELQERLVMEREAWEENYRKKHDTWLAQKERELKEQVRKERDKEIEMVITRLEEESLSAREDCEKVAEAKIRRLREKFEVETKELENSERKAVQKHNEIKAKLTEVEGENERFKVIIKQKDQENKDIQKLLEKMKEERGRVSDIIRQEFADRIVTTEEENRRIKNEISELRARHRIELDRAKEEVEEIKKVKDAELNEVHERVKRAIVKKEENLAQMREEVQKARKRADHLEGLLEQQRKQLLKK